MAMSLNNPDETSIESKTSKLETTSSKRKYPVIIFLNFFELNGGFQIVKVF